ncbi:endonuclease/exonuclease/phosphatase family protein [Endozoicomonas sp. Mp262]|uniref:endonuclease/exonuclease/phosphatase family protein n=1 Tax=Endozoicomonas sp. Mp262 TaxID=2919499 RepID=UPI0021DA6EE1
MPIRSLKGAISRRINRQMSRQVHCRELEFNNSYPFLNRPIRLLSYNIQVGINTQFYRHYITKGWQHVLPHSDRVGNLDRIASVLPDFDIVALQEVDGGSLRTGFVNQTEYLALKGHFPYWYQQLNRNLGKLAQHSNGLLSRFRPLALEDHKLPGLIPGRGAIMARFGEEQNPLIVVMMHLSLSQRTRNIQLSYIRELIEGYDHVVLMGDMNTHADQLLHDSPLKDIDLHAVNWGENTFPSWRPKRSLDHVLVSPSLQVNQVNVLNMPVSDHLPVAVEVEIPGTFPQK